jgi:hypothetical protein
MFSPEFVKAYLALVTELIAGGRFESSLLVQPAGIPELASVEVLPHPVPAGGTFDLVVRLTMPNPAAVPFSVALKAYPAVSGLPAQLDVLSGSNSASAHAVKAPPPGLYTITATAESNIRAATLHVK